MVFLRARWQSTYSSARPQLGLAGMASRFCLHFQTVLDLLCSTLMAQWLLEIFLDCMFQAVVVFLASWAQYCFARNVPCRWMGSFASFCDWV